MYLNERYWFNLIGNQTLSLLFQRSVKSRFPFFKYQTLNNVFASDASGRKKIEVDTLRIAEALNVIASRHKIWENHTMVMILGMI